METQGTLRGRRGATNNSDSRRMDVSPLKEPKHVQLLRHICKARKKNDGMNQAPGWGRQGQAGGRIAQDPGCGCWMIVQEGHAMSPVTLNQPLPPVASNVWV